MARPETKLTSTKKRQDRYLEARRKKGTLSAGCRAARVSHNTVYAWRREDQADGYTAEEFRRLEQEAVDGFADLLEEEAARRAYKGIDRPVYQGGELVGKVREYSDTLLIFLLKGNRPEKFRERISAEHSGPGGGAIPVNVQHDLSKLSDEEMNQLERLVEKSTLPGGDSS